MITKISFLDTIFNVKETPTSYEMTNEKTNERVLVLKSKIEVKDGFILNRGMKFKILEEK